jgi:uncharacterized protein YcbX
MTITLSQINIYPIKSCAGFSSESWELEPRGFRFDRRWMLVDDEGKFLSQREFPRMTLISVAVKSDYLRVVCSICTRIKQTHSRCNLE